MLQNDVQFANAMRQAILLRKRDWLTNLVQTAADADTANLNEQIIHSVVDWLIDLFSEPRWKSVNPTQCRDRRNNLKIDDQRFRAYPGEETYYHAEKIFPRPPFWRRYLWQIFAVAALGLAVLFAFTTLWLVSRPQPIYPVVLPTPTSESGGVWQGQFTYSPGEPYSGSFQATLRIPSLQAGVITGTLYEPVYGNTTVSVTGMEGGSNQFNQDQLQYVTQLYGHGIGTFLEFTDPSDIQGDQIQLGCSYIAVVYSDGSLHGVWFYPGHIQPDGTFVVNVPPH